jgi:hypothetical protein
MRIAGLVLSALLTVAGAIGPAAEPTVVVSPAHDLRDGQTVSLRARGLPARTPVRIIQCDVLWYDGGCPALLAGTTTARGTISARVTVAAVVYNQREVSESYPVYCRGDHCKLFVVWGDGGEIGAPLEFTGSPATVAVSPRAGLVDRQVRVSGTADGARGRTVFVVQQMCFHKYNDHGCSNAVKLGRTTVRRDGTWGLAARVHAVLNVVPSAPYDCRAPDSFYGNCRISAQVLDTADNPDITFGDALYWGTPNVTIQFRPGVPASGW